MKASNRLTLQQKFGERVSFDKIEMSLYSHGTANLPSMVKQIINIVPEAAATSDYKGKGKQYYSYALGCKKTSDRAE